MKVALKASVSIWQVIWFGAVTKRLAVPSHPPEARAVLVKGMSRISTFIPEKRLAKVGHVDWQRPNVVANGRER